MQHTTTASQCCPRAPRRACRAHNRLALFAKVDAAEMVDPAEANAKRTS